MNKITMWILEIFFGIFAIQTTYKYYKGSSLNWFHTVCWFVSVFIVAFISGELFI